MAAPVLAFNAPNVVQLLDDLSRDAQRILTGLSREMALLGQNPPPGVAYALVLQALQNIRQDIANCKLLLLVTALDFYSGVPRQHPFHP